ncbi:hypothetical protein [Nakamurella leprariae]|uniref:Uncharacterized protein n=1 Tax=Nakamurella leprariae TaxID=2803911 RepID=A0A938YFU4_9ACTN|nr:hypothetical protein [Nakamurella leprariae]MBM9468808.1 hypothetical protein [Nakamurella leprariae]
MGYDQQQILERLRSEPLQAFRDSEASTNFGLTAADESVAAAAPAVTVEYFDEDGLGAFAR